MTEGYWGDSNYNTHAFVRDAGGSVVSFDLGNETYTAAASINAAGDVVGGYAENSKKAHSFIRAPDGKVTTFDPPKSQGSEAGSINKKGEIAGDYTRKDGSDWGYPFKP